MDSYNIALIRNRKQDAIIEQFDIAGYCRISVNEELDRDNTYIENQRNIIQDFVQQKFPDSALTFYEDRADLTREQEDEGETEQAAEHFAAVLTDLQEELKTTKRQRIRDIMKHQESEAVLEKTYDQLEDDLLRRIAGLQNQIAMT